MSVPRRRESVTIPLRDEEATRALGARLAHHAKPGDVVVLTGPLGAGKTVCVKGFVAALDARVDVTSPTFALCHRYATSPPVAHVDCWRMESPAELVDIGLDELLDDGWIALVEWGDRVGLDGSLTIELSVSGPARVATLRAGTDEWDAAMDAMASGASGTG